MALDLREFTPGWHSPGSQAAKGLCTWHGPENCSEPVRWSFRYTKSEHSSERHAACDRGLEEAMAGGYIVGQSTPRREPRASG